MKKKPSNKSLLHLKKSNLAKLAAMGWDPLDQWAVYLQDRQNLVLKTLAHQIRHPLVPSLVIKIEIQHRDSK